MLLLFLFSVILVFGHLQLKRGGPAVQSGSPDKIDACFADKIQNAGVLESDGKEQMQGGDGGEQRRSELRQRYNTEHRQQPARRNIPQPQGRDGLQIFRVDVHTIPPTWSFRETAGGFPAVSAPYPEPEMV